MYSRNSFSQIPRKSFKADNSDTTLLNEDLEKNQAVYIPKKRDKIDMALGNYLNKFPEKEKMQIMFLRESEGVY